MTVSATIGIGCLAVTAAIVTVQWWRFERRLKRFREFPYGGDIVLVRSNWWNVNPPRPSNLCCNPFWQAMQTGTDNETYGALVSYWDGEFHMGYGLPAISLCPWCGGKPRGPSEGEP